MEELSNVLWIGGPAGAGKTTISRLLTRRHGLRWYDVDARTWQHRDRALAMGIALPPCGPGDYDRGPMILEDLNSLPSNPVVVVEGALVTPEMARPRSQAVWLMPSQQAQRARLEKRNPDVHPGLLQGWQMITDQLEGTGATTITVDDQTVEETLAEVERLFTDLLQDDPAVHTLQERQALIRYANQVAVTHCLTGFARLSPPRDPSTTVRTFDCECAAPTCEAVVQLPVSSAAKAVQCPPPSLVATGHQISWT